MLYKSRELRKNATSEENKLWYQYLSKLKIRFLRQKPIDNYILDFYCPIKKIAIEIDGSQHYTDEAIEYDKNRTNRLRKYGIEVIRFTNLEIKKHFIEVCEYIENILKYAPDRKNPQSP